MVLGIIVLPLSIMVTCKETRAVIIALHKKGFTGKDIAASKHLNRPFIGSSRTSSGSIVGRLQGAQESPASARTVS